MMWSDRQRESFELTPEAPPVVPLRDSQVPSTQVSATETIPGQPALRTPPEAVVGTMPSPSIPVAVPTPVPVLDPSKPLGREGRLTPTVAEESEVGESVSQQGDATTDAKSSSRDGYWRPHITIFKLYSNLVSCVLIISHTSMHGYPCPRRLYRYFKPKGGKVKCSPEAMQMWESKSGRFPAAIINMQFKTSHNGPVSTIYNWYPPATEVRS